MGRSNTDVTWCWSPKKVGDNFGKFPIISGHFEMETFHLTVMCCCLFVEEQSSKDKNRVATWYLILWLICFLVCESMGIYVDPVWQFVSVFSFSALLHFGLHHVDLISLLWLKIVEPRKEKSKETWFSCEIPTIVWSLFRGPTSSRVDWNVGGFNHQLPISGWNLWRSWGKAVRT